MRDNKNAAALDSGMTMIAAGLSPYLGTREALIKASAASGASGAGNITSNDLINLQNQQQKMKDMLLRRSVLGGIGKQYGLSPESLIALETSGKLDEVVAAQHTGSLIKVTDAATGQESLHHNITGRKIADVGGVKPPQGIPVKTEGGPTKIIDPRSGDQIGPDIGGPKVLEDQHLLGIINTSLPPDKQMDMKTFLTTVKRAEPNATNDAMLATINKARAPDKQMAMEELVRLLHPGAQTNVYIGPDGAQHPAPQPGFDYKRTIGKDGKPVLEYGPNGLPIQVPISTKAELGDEETKADIAIKQKAIADAAKKEHKERVAATFTASNVGQAIDTVLDLADTPGVAGTFASIARNLSPVKGMSWNTVDAKIKTIDANNVVSALNAMRASSPSGGALGNVTESENKMLASIIASTNPEQDKDVFKKDMIRIKAAMLVMAKEKYDDADGPARFAKDLQNQIDELSVGMANKRGKSKIQQVK